MGRGKEEETKKRGMAKTDKAWSVALATKEKKRKKGKGEEGRAPKRNPGTVLRSLEQLYRGEGGKRTG